MSATYQPTDPSTDDDWYPDRGIRPGYFVGFVLFLILLMCMLRSGLRRLSHLDFDEQEEQADSSPARNASTVEVSSDEKKAILLSYFEAAGTELKISSDCLQESIVQVENEEELQTASCEDDLEAGNSKAVTHLILPSRPKEPVVVNCAICFEPYAEEEYVVWSSNADCSHCFHRDCLVGYLIKVKNGETPCPCCRQMFCNLPKDDDDKKAEA